jgi:hypothetical protein
VQLLVCSLKPQTAYSQQPLEIDLQYKLNLRNWTRGDHFSTTEEKKKENPITWQSKLKY